MTIREKALAFATEAHKGQKRKGSGLDYITHPIAVAELTLQKVKDYYDKFDYYPVDDFTLDLYYVIAVLHDVPEDSDVTLQDIEDHFGRRVREAVDSLTKRDGETYLEAILRAKKDDIGVVVKQADNEHNMSDLKEGTLKDKYRLSHYILSQP